MKKLLILASAFCAMTVEANDCRVELLLLEKAQMSLEDHTALVSDFNQNFAQYIHSYGTHINASAGKKIAPSLGRNLIDSANNFKNQIELAEQNNKRYTRALIKAQKNVENCLTKLE